MKTKKLLSLILLGLLCSIATAWADPTPGEANSSYLDIQKYSTIDDAGINSGAYKMYGYSTSGSVGTLVVSAYEAYKSKGNQKWVTTTAESNQNGTWSATGVFKGSDYYFKDGSSSKTANSAKVSSSRAYSFKVTNCTGVSALIKTASSNTISLTAYPLESDITTRKDAAGTDSDNSNSLKTISVTGLSVSNVYEIVVVTDNSANSLFYEIAFTTSLKTISTEAFSGVKVNGSEITSSKYANLDNVITLTDAYISAPTVALINHITYTDESTENKDVSVTLGAAGATYSGYFSGTAVIGETTYTVKVPVDETPTLEADKDAISVSSARMVTGTASISLTGTNLSGDASVSFASSISGLTINPATITVTDGAVDQSFTVSYQSNDDVAEATVNLTFTVGANSVVIPVTYSSTAAVTTISDVTGAKTWSFEGSSYKPSSDIESPDQNNVIPFANASGYKAGFGYEYLAGKAQYLHAKGGYFQGSVLKFHTTVPGNIVVKFSNTGSSSRPYRYLMVNGTVLTDYKSKTSGDGGVVTTSAIAVPVGDVEIVGVMGTTSGDDCVPQTDANDEYVTNMLRIFSLAFTPVSHSLTPTDGDLYATFYSPSYNVSVPENITAYTATYSEIDENTGQLTLNALTGNIIPADVPVILKAASSSALSDGKIVLTATSESASFSGDNVLKGSDGTVDASSTTYVLGVVSSSTGFYKYSSGKIPANKAYLDVNDLSDQAAPSIIRFVDGENNATNIETIRSSDEAVKFIENGRLLIKRDGITYDAFGRIIR